MNKTTFFIVDDDPAARNMLTEIIEEENLGEVVGHGVGGEHQEETILETCPDVTLVDLLMPEIDGISLAENLRLQGYDGALVMVSQVESKDMVARAYQKGVEFYITKPINRVEIISVLQQVIFIHTVQKSLQVAQKRFLDIPSAPYSSSREEQGEAAYQNPEGGRFFSEQSYQGTRRKLMNLLLDLGIIGETGSNDILRIIWYLLRNYPEEHNGSKEFSNLQSLYREVLEDIKAGREEVREEEVKALEQRLRRTIRQGMDTVAAIGLSDFGDPRFEKYAGSLFDFNEVRNRMNELKKGDTATATRINIKKFLKALYFEVLHSR